MTQLIADTATVLQALVVIASPVVGVLAVLLAAFLVRQGPRHRVEAVGTARTATLHWTLRGARKAARARTERTGRQFSVLTAPLV